VRSITRDFTGQNNEDSQSDSGQSTVEFALLLPLAIGCLLLMVQTLVLVLGQLTLHHEARIAARAAAIATDPEKAARQALRLNDPDSSTAIDVEVIDQLVTVHVHRLVPLAVPILGQFWPDMKISTQLSMALEPPIQVMGTS
jgi:uncharacterized membrane protein